MSDLAVILMLKGERAEARQLLERVLVIRPEDAMAVLDPITPDMEIIENHAYHRLCLFYKGELPVRMRYLRPAAAAWLPTAVASPHQRPP